MEIKGFTYGYAANRGDFRSSAGIKSQDALYGLGNNWVCIAVLNYQKNFYSTEIRADYVRTSSDRDITFAVNKAHTQNVKVCLKPMLNSDDHMWRAHISFPDKNMGEADGYWEAWFKNYTNFMLYYAELAEELNCEMLCIGCEMNGTEHKVELWRSLIAKIRKAYSGKVVYNANHGREGLVEWFDELDYLGTSAYYPVGKTDGNDGTDRTIMPSKESMTEKWREIRDRINKVADTLGKKYIFMEIGCRSATGCSAMPWDFFHRQLPWNEDEQAMFYESCLDVFGEEKRFAGVFWWDWSTLIYHTEEEAKEDIGFNIHLKKAEQILKERYAK